MLPFLMWVEFEGIILSEISQTEKDKYHMISLICAIYKNKTKEQTKQKQIHRYRDEISGYRGEGVWRGC